MGAVGTFQTAQRFTADRGGRMYRTPEGQMYPSVTTILQVVGKPALINWAANTERAMVIEAAANLWDDAPTTGKKMSRTAYVATLTERIGKQKAHQKELAKAAEIGSQVHALIEWNLRKELGQSVGPEPVIHEKALWAFMAYEDWRKQAGLKPTAIEQVVWSDQHHYAGTMDLYADLLIEPVGSSMAVLDWKTGKGIYPEALLQNAAYVQALVEMGHAPATPYGVICRFPKVETDPEFEVKIITPAEQADLFRVFLAVRDLWEWSQAQEKARKAG